MKITIVGAGSFVFGPSMLAQALLENRLDNCELALMDVDEDAVEAMAAVGRFMATQSSLHGVTVSAHTNLDSALSGAEYVICCAAKQIASRYKTDCDIINRYMPDHRVTEFGGIYGIAYSLRQIALVEQIVGVMRRVCPNAWLLNISNPLPRVCQAAHEEGIKTAGFCSVSSNVLGQMWKLFTGKSTDYPWKDAEDAYAISIAGLNHCSFLLSAIDRSNGNDLRKELVSRLKAGATMGSPRCERFAIETGFLLVPNDHHTADFLEPDNLPFHPDAPFHGSAEQRAHRIEELHRVSRGEYPVSTIIKNPSWERPIDFIQAYSRGGVASFHTLSLSNNDQHISNMPKDAFVETSCTVSEGTVTPSSHTMPSSTLPLLLRTAEITSLIVRAARTKDRGLVFECVNLDPTITDKQAGLRAMTASLDAHADIIGF